MKKSTALILLTLLIISCGLPTRDKDTIKASFKNTLRNVYTPEGLILHPLEVEIVSMKKYKKGIVTDGLEYSGLIKCEFNEGNNSVIIWFDAGFDKYKQIIKMPEVYGKNKLDIMAVDILVNTRKEILTDLASSKYVLDCFLNRNDFLKNTNKELRQ